MSHTPIPVGHPGAAARSAVGVGLRHPHYRDFLEGAHALDFVEVHSENYFGDGGAALGLLEQARARCDVSLHGVGLSLGSAAGLDPWHLERLAALVERIEPVRVSDHASFARTAWPRHAGSAAAQVVHLNDLLPVAFTEDALAIMCENVQQVQERLGRELVVENLSAYLDWADSTMSEAQFLAQLCRRTGCRLLLDLNNLVVNGLNAGRRGRTVDPVQAAMDHVDALPVGSVAEIHLAGHLVTPDLVIDHHGSRVDASVWAVYRHALQRFGTVPTLIEWDTDLPEFDVLLDEAACAADCQREMLLAPAPVAASPWRQAA